MMSSSAPQSSQSSPQSPQVCPLIPSPLEGGPNGGAPSATAEELLRSLQTHAADNGYAITRKNAANYRDGKPTRYTICCDRGKKRESRSKGIRQVKTRLDGCEFRGVIKAAKIDDGKWTFQVKNPKILVSALSNNGIKTMGIMKSLQEHYPDIAVRSKDINNYVQQLKQPKEAKSEG
ncbi:uncharacterized protein BCR38DRAFT_159096 [Pseudomassariella vexata]|uniref:FAR1 domain-containing protein n=1 Tax=Pseudomassariella vexata TaxID=1141098 RepID=A0A1Y2E7G1_9PEZI|nr:uncharacterized protein BCR38DRAFT_159096 [Pseudomassariella vexata]ORY67480.1 hypothetical protein BCR38DRAFT_159096 [Pseudomassariella vexata]